MIQVLASHTSDKTSPQEHVLIRDLDFSCAGEGAGLERRLRRIVGVTSVTVNPLTETAYVTFDPGRTNLAELEFVVRAAGYRLR